MNKNYWIGFLVGFLCATIIFSGILVGKVI
jgi:hypothetical protein